jgi:hypothetical protein
MRLVLKSSPGEQNRSARNDDGNPSSDAQPSAERRAKGVRCQGKDVNAGDNAGTIQRLPRVDRISRGKKCKSDSDNARK